MRIGKRRQARQCGYTYLLVLFAVAALGLGGAQVGVVWQQTMLREREAELIYRAADIARAIGRYHLNSPVGAPAWPQKLEDLVEDKRFPMTVRHLRRIWRDPFTGKPDWELVMAGGGIVGVRSRSDTRPIRTHGLPPELEPDAAMAERHADWLFRPVVGQPSGEPDGAAAESRTGWND